MVPKNGFRNVLQLGSLLFILFAQQSAIRVGLPKIEGLATRLKPTECRRIVSDDVDLSSTRKEANTQRTEKECYERLINWAVRLKLSPEKMGLMLKYRLKEIGRNDLARWLTKSEKTQRDVSKVVRTADSIEEKEIPMDDVKEIDRDLLTDNRRWFLSNLFADNDLASLEEDSKSRLEAKLNDLLDITTTNFPQPVQKNKENEKEGETPVEGKIQEEEKKTNNTILSGLRSFRISLLATGIIIIVTILVTCYCTLFLRKKLMKICNVCRRKKKKSKFTPMKMEEAIVTPRRRGLSGKKSSQKKRKRAPSYEIVRQQERESIAASAPPATPPPPPPEPEEPSPTGCYRCYKKKRKKKTKRQKR